MTKVNDSRTRCIAEQPFGIACYEGVPQGDQFVGQHQGVCRDWEDAEVWLRGGHPDSFVRIYPLVRVQ